MIVVRAKSITDTLTLGDSGSVTGKTLAPITQTDVLTLGDSVSVVKFHVPISVTDSLTLNDSATVEIMISVSDVLTFVEDATSAKTQRESQELVSNVDKEITVNPETAELVITSETAALETIIITEETTDPTINYATILVDDPLSDINSITVGTGWTVDADIIDNDIVETGVTLSLQDNTVISGANWDGVLELPKVEIIEVPSEVVQQGDIITTTTYTDIEAISVGLGAIQLDLTNPAQLTFPGRGGQNLVAFFERSGVTTLITIQCDGRDTPTVNGVDLAAGEECFFDDGSDIIIWTTHFTGFGTAKRSTSTSSAPSTSNTSTTGSNSGTGKGPGSSGASGFGVILFSPLEIHEISYDVCSENMVAILVANDDAVIPTITLQTTKSGTIEAVLAVWQPFEEKNEFTTVDKYLFVAPLDPKETYFMVQVKAADGAKVNAINSAVKITECQETILFNEMPEEFEGIDYSAPGIFDVKIQIDDGTPQSAISPEVTYLDEQELTVSAIVDSQVPLKRAELRYMIAGESEDDYIAFMMDVTPIEGVYTAAKISASIPPVLMVAPGIEYWIHVMDENFGEATSQHYTMGVKPAYDVDASIELIIPSSKPEGSIIRPSAYVTNHAEGSAFGTVSLLVDGKVVSSTTEFFGEDQTQVLLEWVIPKEGQHMVHVFQAKLDLYGTSATTEKAYVSSFMKTQIISISEIQTVLPITDQAGSTIAQPALLYASDSTHDNLRFRVIDNEGFCFIGATDECAVKESTMNNRGGIQSIEHNGIIYRVTYSGVDSPLERFSITSVDQVGNDWNITLESMDDLIPQAYAIEDIHLKVKYRTVSEITVVSSE